MLPLKRAGSAAGVQSLSPQQRAEIRRMIFKGDKTAADAARLFKIHPATVSRLLARQSEPRSRNDRTFQMKLRAIRKIDSDGVRG